MDRGTTVFTTRGKFRGIVPAMSEETSPERLQLVEKLAKAINRKERVERSKSRPEERQKAAEAVGAALEAVRSHKVGGGRKSKDSEKRKAS